MKRLYFIGLLRKDRTIVFQLRPCKDDLDCEIWRYLGGRFTTKARVREHLSDPARLAAVLIYLNIEKPAHWPELTEVRVD